MGRFTVARGRSRLDGDSLRAEALPAAWRCSSDLRRRATRFLAGQLAIPGRSKARVDPLDPLFRRRECLGGHARCFQPRIDRSLDGGPLQLGGSEYRQGNRLCTAVRSLSIACRKSAASFQAIVGIDDRLPARRQRAFADPRQTIARSSRTIFPARTRPARWSWTFRA